MIIHYKLNQHLQTILNSIQQSEHLSVFNTMESCSRFAIDSTATAFANITKPAGNSQLRNHGPEAINQLIFDLHERNGSFIGEVGILKEQKAEEIALIQPINTQYHLKDNNPTKITN